MKTLGLLFCLLGIATTALAKEHLWENFDEAPLGSITNQMGWSSLAPPVTAGEITDEDAYSPEQSLLLPSYANGASAIYGDLGVNGHAASNHAVVRFSAMIFTPNSNTVFQMGLLNTNNDAFLSFLAQGGYGHIGFQDHSAVAVPLITNRFANVTLFYNRSNDMFRLDYNHTNQLDWTPSGVVGGPIEDFHQFVIHRLNNSASTTGDLLIDNVRVETFPPYVTAWWRCDDLDRYSDDRLGQLYPARRNTFGVQESPSSSDPVYDGQFDFHNTHALSGFVSDHATNSTPTPANTNWTAEAVFRTPQGDGNIQFIEWGTGLGFNTNGAYVSFSFTEYNQQLVCTLRDAEQTNSTYASIPMGEFIPDNHWHHAALVKSNTTVSLFLDYQWVTDADLTVVANGTAADGTYPFDTDSRVSLGTALNGTSETGTDSFIDEVRFSAKALELHEFLQPGQPLLVDLRNSALLNPWELVVKVILDRTYRVETSSALGPAANWQKEGLSFVGAYTFQYIDVSTVPKTNFVRVIREN